MMDIHKIGVNNYRNAIACVLQDDRLFSGSIAENISGFEVNATERIVACAMHSNIHEEIMQMPMGYETLIGELGTASPAGKSNVRLLHAPSTGDQACCLWMKRPAIWTLRMNWRSTGRYLR